MATIETTNHGSLILTSTFWGSEAEAAGKVWCSCNAGTVRVLLPRTAWPLVEQCRAAEYAILSRGPWKVEAAEAVMDDPPAIPEGVEAVELLFDDHTGSPVVLHLTPASFDLLPAEPPPGREWLCALWTQKKGKPHKALERKCHWRRAEFLPWLRAWGEDT